MNQNNTLEKTFETTPLAVAKCTESQRENFYVAESTNGKAWFENNVKYAMCIENSQQIELFGEMNDGNFQVLDVHIKKCQKAEGKLCKSDEEIDEFFST